MGNLLSDQSLQSFNAEVEFLSKFDSLRKEAAPKIPKSLLSRAGSMVGRSLGGVGKTVADQPNAVRETLSLAQHPLKSMAKGWKDSTWMGKGKVTKYLPIGMKSMMAGFAVPGLHDAYQAYKNETPTPTGEGGGTEKLLGEVGGTGGMIAGLASKRILPGLALMMGGQWAGNRLGRVIDRMRGGANLGTALSAPSPEEASGQLENIQRYYE